jgi:uncharacterized protein YcbX
MRVAELWRYPVKSLQGERLDSVRVGIDGLEGASEWAPFEGAPGSFHDSSDARASLVSSGAGIGAGFAPMCC